MLTRKPSRFTDDVQEGNSPLNRAGIPSAFTTVPPTRVGDPEHADRGREACRMVSVNLSAYLDNELDSDQQALIATHLNTCVDCAALLEALEETDEAIQREWRESAPLPSSSGFKQSVDSIMDALPPVPPGEPAFAAKRVHARTRWTRFATGMSSILLAAGLLWSSYRLGYAHGRKSTQRLSYNLMNPDSAPSNPQTLLSLCSLTPPPSSGSPPAVPDTPIVPSARERFQR